MTALLCDYGRTLENLSMSGLGIVMFCQGWQNKASRATDGTLKPVTPKQSHTFSDILRFSYVRTSERSRAVMVQFVLYKTMCNFFKKLRFFS